MHYLLFVSCVDRLQKPRHESDDSGTDEPDSLVDFDNMDDIANMDDFADMDDFPNVDSTGKPTCVRDAENARRHSGLIQIYFPRN